MSFFLEHLWKDPSFFFSWIIIVIFSICMHEYCHAWTALRFGDTTARDAGMLSLDPRRVMGIPSMVCLCLFGIAWGAVPIAPWVFRKWQRSLVCLAGPFSNLGLAFVFSWFALIFLKLRIAPVGNFFGLSVLANCFLFVFNLLPVPGLDGWGALEAFFPKMSELSRRHGGTITLIIILLLFATPFSNIIWKVSNAVSAVLTLCANFVIRV
ncbi:MAG: site-2 protease family protein [Victivallales bacterium]|nr:site-2 protease family protein [Victivallales bacterium]